MRPKLPAYCSSNTKASNKQERQNMLLLNMQLKLQVAKSEKKFSANKNVDVQLKGNGLEFIENLKNRVYNAKLKILKQ